MTLPALQHVAAALDDEAGLDDAAEAYVEAEAEAEDEAEVERTATARAPRNGNGQSLRTRRSARGSRPRAYTVAAKPLTRAEQAAAAELRASSDFAAAEAARPRTRSDCVGGPRPCPWARCRWNLHLDVNPETGAVKLNFPHLEIDQMSETCALDVADRGGATLEDVGVYLRLTRERVRQVEAQALVRLVFAARQLDGR